MYMGVTVLICARLWNPRARFRKLIKCNPSLLSNQANVFVSLVKRYLACAGAMKGKQTKTTGR
jgi:hypothetical protein